MPKRNNVVELRPGRLTPSAIEDIETILLMQLGREVLIDQVEFTPKTMDQLFADLGPATVSESYSYPVCRWQLKNDAGRVLTLVAIDTGHRRAFYSTASESRPPA